MYQGQKIRQARESLRESQVAFSQRLGVSPRTLQRWEAGDDVPDANQAWKIAQATAKHLDWFFDPVPA